MVVAVQILLLDRPVMQFSQ